MLRVHVQTRTHLSSLRVHNSRVCVLRVLARLEPACCECLYVASTSTRTREYGWSRLRVVALALASESARSRE